MRRSLTAPALLACALLIPLSLATGGRPALAADAFGLGIERLRSASAATRVEADRVEYQEERKVLVGRGDVMVRFDDRVLYADEVRVNLQTQEFVATGHVLLVEGTNRLEGDRLEFNYGNNLGVIHNGRVFLYPNTSFRGLEIRKVGEREYRIHQGAYTSCRVCQPEPGLSSWEFRAEDSTIIQDEVFSARHLTAWTLDTLPVFYFPALSMALGPRRTGFLLPRFAYTNLNGFTYRQPFFWAISESQDATLTGTYRSKRGYQIEALYRYILSPRASGEWSGSYLNDRTGGATQDNRYEVHGRHEQFFTPNLSLKANINYISDNNIYRDFLDHSLAQRTARTVDSNVFLTQAAEVYNAMLLTSLNRTLTNSPDTRLQVLPEFGFTLFDRPILGLPLAVGGVSSAGYFQRTNVVDAGRTDFAPHLRIPWAPAPWLGFLGTAGVRETVYSAGNPGFSGTPTRSLYDLGGEAEARFARVFEVGGRELSQLMHLAAPKLAYQYTPFVDQQRFPQFDLQDFVSPQNRLTYGLENRFIGRFRDEAGNVTSREVARLGVAQSFNFRPRTHVFSNNYLTSLTPERVDNAVTNILPVLNAAASPTDFSQADERQFSNLVFSLQATPHPYLLFRSEMGLNTAKSVEEGANLQFRFTYPGLGFLSLSYTQEKSVNLQGILGSVGASITPELSVTYLTRYSPQQGIFFEHNVLARYTTCCWEVSLRYIYQFTGPGNPTQNGVLVQFELKTGRVQQAPAAPPPPIPGTEAPGTTPGRGAGSVDGPAVGR